MLISFVFLFKLKNSSIEVFLHSQTFGFCSFLMVLLKVEVEQYLFKKLILLYCSHSLCLSLDRQRPSSHFYI